MKRTLALSCFVLACGTPKPTITYYKDVLPITQTSCNTCHVAGGIAPFALDTYSAARPMAKAMAESTKQKRMPPWLASKDCGGPFVGDRSLSDAQITTLNDWAEGGALEGNSADAPAPAMPAVALKKVDLTKQMTEPYTPTIKDDYRCFIIDPGLTQAQTVTGYDITPGSQKVVHHVILYMAKRTDALAQDAKDTKAGWECFGGADVATSGAMGVWAPGGSAVKFPPGTGISITPDEVLAMQVHYNTDNGTATDQTSVKLMFGNGTENKAVFIPLVAKGFNIPPNAVDYKYSKTFTNTLGFPLKIWGLLPHMHTKGKTISIKGDNNECLVDVARWDFHWQSVYFRQKAFPFNEGATMNINCSWDNPTSSNVKWGEGTSDEMCFAFVYATL
jgi:hypothetical protein